MAKAIFGVSGIVGGKTGAIIRGAVLIGVGIASGNPALVVGGVATIAGALKKTSGVNNGRLNLTFNPDAARKWVPGKTAMATDVLYTEPGGTDQEYQDYIICVAAHAVESIDKIHTDDKLMWSAGTVQTLYSGYVTVDIRLEGTSSNGIPINGGGTWTSACTLTGCAYIHLRVKRTGNSKKAESPFVNGLPGRMTIEGKGMKLYDPRRDSTRGGSGSHRADNQATWEFASSGTEIGQNHVLQALSFLLGWKIGGLVSVGIGMPVDRIDFADFITAANICDEAVTLALSGTQRRYEGAGVFGDDSDPTAVLEELCKHMNAELRDVNGKLGIRIAYNDLGGTLPAFTIDDVLGGYEWTGFAPLHETPNNIRGKWTDASTASLYNTAPYTKISVTSPDGINRADTLDLPMCQDAERAQRIAQQVLLRGQAQATFKADFGPRAWALRPGDPLTLTFSPAGLASQKFRVVEQALKVVFTDEGAQQFCGMTLRSEDPAIYAYTAGVYALPASAIPPVSYNPYNIPLAITEGTDIGVENGADVTGAHTSANSNALGGTSAATVASNIATAATTATGAGITGPLPDSLIVGTTGYTLADVTTAAFSGGSGSGYPPVGIIVGTSNVITVSGSGSLDAQYTGIATGSGSVTATLLLQSREAGGSWSTLSGGTDVQTGTVGDSFSAFVPGVAWSISGGGLGELRAVLTCSSGDSLSLSPSDSYMVAG